MGSLQRDSGVVNDLDDSGCVRDVSPGRKEATAGSGKKVELLDFSDDVLLYILRYCSPWDLKALGFTCARLGMLICDRTLWQYVDARAKSSGRKRLHWFMTHGLSQATKTLKLSGYAKLSQGCLGHINAKRGEIENIQKTAMAQESCSNTAPTPSTSGSNEEPSAQCDDPDQVQLTSHFRRFQQMCEQHLPRLNSQPAWPECLDEESLCEKCGYTSPVSGVCPGPKFTLNTVLLQELQTKCCNLTTLYLEYCNINCKTTGINNFPGTLKRLSLRGTKCFNSNIETSIIFKMPEHLPGLVYLNVSECEWLKPSTMLPLSKMPSLEELVARDCYKLTEFVAYASIATRYGFKKLRLMDLRGSPVGDSEVSGLGWLPNLQELYMSPPSQQPKNASHHHCTDDPLPFYCELDPWEMQEPAYFKSKEPPHDPKVTCFKCESNSMSSGTSSNERLKRSDSKMDEQSSLKRKPDSEPPAKKPKRDDQNGNIDSDSSDDDDSASKGNKAEIDDTPGTERREELPLHKVLYVNVGRRLNAVQRPPMEQGPIDLSRNEPNRRGLKMIFCASPIYSTPSFLTDSQDDMRYDPTTLVSDSAMRRFGRADGEHINYVNIGPNGICAGPPMDPGARSNLTVLSATGYRNITDQTLVHLVTAAPDLRFLDLSGTGVTERGVENFKCLRPECEVVFSPLKKDSSKL